MTILSASAAISAAGPGTGFMKSTLRPSSAPSPLGPSRTDTSSTSLGKCFCGKIEPATRPPSVGQILPSTRVRTPSCIRAVSSESLAKTFG